MINSLSFSSTGIDTNSDTYNDTCIDTNNIILYITDSNNYIKFKWLACEGSFFLSSNNELIKIHIVDSLDLWKNDLSIIYETIMYKKLCIDMYNMNFNKCLFFYIYMQDSQELDYTQIDINFLNNICRNHIYYTIVHLKNNMNNIIKMLHTKWILCNLSNYMKSIGYNLGRRPSSKRTRNSKLIKSNKPLNIDTINTSDTIIDHKQFISPQKLKNYIFGDTLFDWIKEYGHDFKGDFQNKYSKTSSLTKEVLFKYGNDFENFIFKKLKNKFNTDMIQICDNKNLGLSSLKHSKFMETVYHLNIGTPIIYQGVLHNNIDNTFGTPDLLVRSDYINKLTSDTNIISKQDSLIKATNLRLSNGKFHYRIIDIKASTLTFKANGKYIINNTKMIQYYKTQLYLYNIALGYIQGYNPNESYILAKRLVHPNVLTYKFDEKLAVVNYLSDDASIVDLYTKSVKWIRYMQKYGAKWDINNPHIHELLPNIKNPYSSYHELDDKSPLKHVITTLSQNDIALLWQCSKKNRLLALNNGITNWRKQICSPIQLGFKKESTIYKPLDIIIKMNQDPEIYNQTFKGRKILTTNLYPEKFSAYTLDILNTTRLEIYLDFESVNILNAEGKNEEILFMIGCGFVENGEWNFKQFILNELTYHAEFNNLLAFFKFINQINNQDMIIYHWGNYEEQILQKKCDKYKLTLPNMNLFDLIKMFKSEPIVVRGMTNFSLKNVANSFYNNGFIQTTWDTSIKNGMDAMFIAKKAYLDCTTMDERYKIINDIAKYNEVDCKVMWEIIIHLRKPKSN